MGTKTTINGGDVLLYMNGEPIKDMKKLTLTPTGYESRYPGATDEEVLVDVDLRITLTLAEYKRLQGYDKTK